MSFLRRSLLALVVGTAAPAYAQEVLPPTESLVTFNRSTTVQERRLKGYEARGLSLGTLKLEPQLTLSPRFTDNVYSTTGNRKSEFYVNVSPQIQAGLQTGQTLVALQATADLVRHAEFLSENQDNVRTSGFVLQSIGPGTKLGAGMQYENASIDRESQQAFALTVRPFRYHIKSYAIRASQKFAGLLLSAQGGITQYSYGNGRLVDGTLVDQSFNDRERKRAQVRAEVKQSASIAYFIEATYDATSFDRLTDALVDRSSDRLKVLVGTRFELPILARGDIAIGYTKSQFKGDIFRSFSGLAVSSDITFFPTQLTNVTLNARREVQDAGISQSSGYVALVGGVRVDHELLRALILTAQAQYERDSFNNIDRTDRRLTYLFGSRVKLNRNITLQLNFERVDFLSKGLDRNVSNIKPTFSRDRIDLQISLRI